MNSIWSNLYDRFKDRRYAAFFYMAFFGFLLLLLIAILALNLLSALPNPNALGYIVGGIFGAAMAGCVLAGLRRWRSRRQERLTRFPELSSDELRAARSKLVKSKDRRIV